MNNNYETCENNELETSKQQCRKNKPSIAFRIGTILAIICFAIASFYAYKALKPTYKLEDFKQKIQKLHTENNEANQKLFEEFKRNLQNAGEPEFARARANVGATVNSFCKFKPCVQLTYAMARDKIKKTHEAQDMINSIVGNKIVKPCAAGGAAIQDLTANFIHRLQENDNRFKAACADELQNFSQGSDDYTAAQNFVNDITEFNRQLNNYLVSSSFTAIGTAVEIIFIRQLIASLGRLLGPIAAKAAGSAAAPLLDGPLPIMDIIAVGGAAWCAYDIYQVLKVMPQNLRNSLHTAIANYSRRARAEALACAEKALALSVNSSQQALNAIQ